MYPEKRYFVIKQHLDLTSGRDRGRIYRVAATDHQPDREALNLADASVEALVNLLAHPNAWHRETASRLLYERQDQTSVGPLKKLAAGAEPLGRLHAMYALSGLGALDTSTLLVRLDDSPRQSPRRPNDRRARVAGLKEEVVPIAKETSFIGESGHKNLRECSC